MQYPSCLLHPLIFVFLHQIGIDGKSRPLNVSETGKISSSIETKSLKEMERNTQTPLIFEECPKDLEKRNVTALITVLKQCRTSKNGDGLPDPELAFRRAAATGKLDVLKALLELVKDIDINQPGSESGKTAIMYAQEYGHKEIVAFLRKAGAKLEGVALEGKRSVSDSRPKNKV